ncbi:hypothetical protein YC2023_004313 [Brassica napus]
MIAPVSTSLSFLYILFAANPSVRPWGAHDFLAVLFRAKKCIEVNDRGAHMIFLPFCFERKSALRLTALRKHQKHLENPLSIFFRVKKN